MSGENLSPVVYHFLFGLNLCMSETSLFLHKNLTVHAQNVHISCSQILLLQNSAASEPSNHPSSDKGRESSSGAWEGKVDLWKPLNCLVEAANRSKSSKFGVQGSLSKSEALHSHDNEGLLNKTKTKEHRQKSKAQDEKNSSDRAPPESERPKKFRKIRQKKARNSGEFRAPPQVVLDSASAKLDRRNYPIWFSLVSDKQ